METKCETFRNCKEGRKVCFVKNGYTIQECKVCGHRFTQIHEAKNHIENIYSNEYFLAGKQGYPNYLDGKDILMKTGKRYAKLISRYRSTGQVLDVGCAAGFILKAFEEFGWKCYGLEPNDTMASYGRNILNLQVKTGDFESFQTSQTFDLVNLIQVIGHLIDLDAAIKNLVQLVKKDGLVLVESWDMDSGYAKLMGKHWHEYSPPSVVNWFSDKTLIQFFKKYKFRLVAKGRPLKQLRLKHGLSLFEEVTPPFILKNKMIKLLNNSIGKYHIVYPLLDVKWYLFEKIAI